MIGKLVLLVLGYVVVVASIWGGFIWLVLELLQHYGVI